MPACPFFTASDCVRMTMPSVAMRVHDAMGFGNQKILGSSPSMMRFPSGPLRGEPASTRHMRQAPTGER